MANLGKNDSSPIRMVLLAAFLISTILLLSQRGGSHFSQPAQRAAEDVISPIAQILSTPIRAMENIAFGIKDRSRAHQENIELRKELIVLRDAAAQSDLLELKLKRYERILSVNLDANIPRKKIVARAVSESHGPFVRSLLLNSGTHHGINIGNPVMSSDGLIGHVINAGHQSSRVLQLGDLNSRIPVLNKRSESKAILSGDNSLRPVLTFIQDASDWAAGDHVITSGDDGMLPIGLPVGVVVKGKGKGLFVKLHAEKAAIDWVWVSPYNRISAPSDTDIENTSIDDDLSELTNTVSAASGPAQSLAASSTDAAEASDAEASDNDAGKTSEDGTP